MPEILPSSISFCGSRMEAMTFQPFDANSFAVARPKPDEAPVIKIALWSWLLITASSNPIHSKKAIAESWGDQAYYVSGFGFGTHRESLLT